LLISEKEDEVDVTGVKERSLLAQQIWKTTTGAERVRCRIPGNDSRFWASYRKQLLKGS